MERKKFNTMVKQELIKTLGDKYDLTLLPILKNNGVTFDSLQIHKEGNPIGPVIYLDQFYKKFQNGVPFKYIIFKIIEIIKESSHDGNKFAYIERDLKDLNNIITKIIMKVVNTEKNKEMLTQLPHKELMDLSIIFLINCDSSSEIANIQITNNMLKMWNITEDSLYGIAQANTAREFPGIIQPIEDVLNTIIMTNNDIEIEPDIFKNSVGLYVVSNEKRVLGAINAFSKIILRKFAEASKSNVYILPSSIHEGLLLAESPEMDPKSLKEMVMDVNRNEVLAEEILSDSVYYYNRKTDKISIVA